MRKAIFILAMAVFVARAAEAQDRPGVELGTTLGGTLSLPDDGDATVFLGVPGAGTLLAFPNLYVTLFPSPSFMVEPQVYFWFESEDSNVIFSGMMQLGYLFTPQRSGSLYAAAHGGYYTITDGVDTGALGASFGYRALVGEGAALRVEGRFRRWLCEDCQLSDVSVVLGIGIIL
ncbi:MAG: hypothetical protein JSW71_21825 [Gemmatimonadota bacterium]|nr:MAG: hypothetical protein JSW71_21825 [Gemmatimonadota bacterium]